LEISSSFQQRKNFENQLRFEKVIAKFLVTSFFGTQCRKSAAWWFRRCRTYETVSRRSHAVSSISML